MIVAASTAPNMSRGEFLDRPIDARNGGKAVIPSSFVVCHNTAVPRDFPIWTVAGQRAVPALLFLRDDWLHAIVAQWGYVI